MKLGLVHDWLVSPIGGGENVLKAIHEVFPSPIFTLVQNRRKLKGSYFEDLEISSSFIQSLPFASKKYRSYLPLFPLAVEQLDVSGFDVVISTSHCVAKGVMTGPDQLHICYCFTPMRYAWDLMHQYLEEVGFSRGVRGVLAKTILHYLRGWDVHSSKRVDAFVTMSKYIARRIQKYYGRDSQIIYPPVDIDFFTPGNKKGDYYFTHSRMVPYKKIDVIVEAFSKMPNQKLFIVGEGPEEAKIRCKASQNVELLGQKSREEIREYLRGAKGFLFAAIEDFGIAPIEAMACGTPVIGLGKGALLETVQEGTCGIFFAEQKAELICDAVLAFEKMTFDPEKIRQWAEQFSLARFQTEFKQFVFDKYHAFRDHLLR